MNYSHFQHINSEYFKWIFSTYLNKELHDEVRIGQRKTIDLASQDGEYGFEFKSGYNDLNTGYGLNQIYFKNGYLVVPDKYKYYALGKLYCDDMWRSGLITVKEDGRELSLIKPINEKSENDFEKLFS